MGEPAIAQALEPSPAVMGFECDAEDLAELAVEVGEVALRVAQHGEAHIGQALQALGEQAQDDSNR